MRHVVNDGILSTFNIYDNGSDGFLGLLLDI